MEYVNSKSPCLAMQELDRGQWPSTPMPGTGWDTKRFDRARGRAPLAAAAAAQLPCVVRTAIRSAATVKRAGRLSISISDRGLDPVVLAPVLPRHAHLGVAPRRESPAMQYEAGQPYFLVRASGLNRAKLQVS
jgi:hypothetical protein